MRSHDDLEIHLSGADVADRANALQQRLSDGLGAENVSRSRREWAPEPDGKFEGHEVVTIVLAVPSAVLATMEIAKRLKLVERLRPLIEDIQKTYEGISPECHIKPPGESLKTPAETSTEAILDAAQKVIREKK